MEVVENQLRDLDPPETKQTFDRLLAEGIDDDEARRMIAAVVVAEIHHMEKNGTPFNRRRYSKGLSRLPSGHMIDQQKQRTP